jgi:NADH-quinone oxidoreductase subunit M
LILLGAFKANVVLGTIATSGVILAACYMLWMYQRVIFGKITNPENEKLLDLNAREKLVLIPLVALVFWIGIYPAPLLDRIQPAVTQVINQVGQAQIVELPDDLQLASEPAGQPSTGLEPDNNDNDKETDK